MKNLVSKPCLILLLLSLSSFHLVAQIKTMSGALLQTSEIDEFLEKKMSQFEMPGISLAIINEGKVVFHTVKGVKHLETQEPITDKTLFEGASITKPVFAYLCMKLVQRGLLDLDKPLYQYKTFEDIAYDERYKKITARIVLTHKTGFPNWRYENKGMELDIRFEPGSEFNYSGEGFVYLSRVVEQICQAPIEELIQREVFDPLSMENSFMLLPPDLEPYHAFGHFDKNPSAGIWQPKRANVASSIRSESQDFAKFMMAIMEGEGLDEDIWNIMLTEQVAIPEDHIFQTLLDIKGFGLGFGIEPTPFGEVVGHGGNNGDFQSYFQVDRKRKLGFVFFTNSNKAFDYNNRAKALDFSQELENFLHTGESEPEVEDLEVGSK